MLASAFCQACAKIATSLLRDVLHGAASKFAETFSGPSTWRGPRVLAVDGSKFNLARGEELDSHFAFISPGLHHVIAGGQRYDVVPLRDARAQSCRPLSVQRRVDQRRYEGRAFAQAGIRYGADGILDSLGITSEIAN